MTYRYSCSLSYGAQLIAPDQTRFRVWAPSAKAVSVLLQNGEALAMSAKDGGWYEANAQAAAGTRYRYRMTLDDGSQLDVPDPASRAQAGDVHDPSVVVDPLAYGWRHGDWKGRPWHETVLYELHVGAFGGFEGVMRKLPELAALGITAVELMPVADFPGARNWGYDGVLPYAPDAAYGTPEQLKALIDTAHGLGLMVFLDVVYNHFGPDGNYLNSYAAPFFRHDIATPWGQAIDFRRSEVGNYFVENAIYWLEEYRFDGLRFDAVHAISEQGWLEELARRVRAEIGTERHIHLVLEHDGNAAHLLERAPGKGFDAQWNDDGHHVLHVLLTGESGGYYVDYADQPAEKLARVLSEGFVYQGDPSAHRDGELRGEPSDHLPPTAFVLFLQNHDQIGNRAFGERLISLADPRALSSASALLLLSPQIPMLFMGEEYGATQPFLYFTSHPDPALAEAVRNGRRQEFAKFPAFADPEVRARIPDPNDEATFTQSIPYPDESSSWAGWTMTLLALRQREIIPRLAGTHAIGAKAVGPEAVIARWRLGDGKVLAMAVNTADAPVQIGEDDAMPAIATGTLLFETENATEALARGELPAFGFIALFESQEPAI